MCQGFLSAYLQKMFAIQGDLARLEIWTDRSLIHFNKGKSKVVPLGQSNPSTRWGLELLRSSFEEQLRVLVEHRLTRDQQCVLVIKKATPSWAALTRIQPSRLWIMPMKWILLFWSAIVTTIWWTISWAPQWKKDVEILNWHQWRDHCMESVWMRPQDWWGAAVPDVKEETEETDFVLCELKKKRKLQGWLFCCLHLSDWRIQRRPTDFSEKYAGTGQEAVDPICDMQNSNSI